MNGALDPAALAALGALALVWDRGSDRIDVFGARDLLAPTPPAEGASWAAFAAAFGPGDRLRLEALIADAPLGGEGAVLLLRAPDGVRRLRLRAGWLDPDRLRLAALVTPAFGDSGEAAEVGRPALARALEAAVAADELEAWFQPVVDLRDRRLLGAEALVRWVLPDGTVIGPDEILPLAAEAGLAAVLGRAVRAQVARCAAIWARAGFAGYVSFNVSASDLAHGDLAGELTALRAAHDLRPGALRLELTEGEALHDPDAAAQALAAVRAAGASVAIDDFGVGHASLAWLSRLPADGLKIDRYFVRTLDAEGTGSHAILSSILALARTLKLDVVAEGVESETDAARLIALGCDAAQGFWLGPPRPAAAFARHLADTSADRGPMTGG